MEKNVFIPTYLNVATLVITASRPVSWLSYKENIFPSFMTVHPFWKAQSILNFRCAALLAYILWQAFDQGAVSHGLDAQQVDNLPHCHILLGHRTDPRNIALTWTHNGHQMQQFSSYSIQFVNIQLSHCGWLYRWWRWAGTASPRSSGSTASTHPGNLVAYHWQEQHLMAFYFFLE